MNYRSFPVREAGPLAEDEALGARPEARPHVHGWELRRYAGTVWRYKWTMALVMAVCLVGGYWLAARTPPVYAATSTVMLNTRETNIVNIDSVLSGLSDDYSAVAGEIEIIRSYSLLERVVEKLHLETDEELNPPDVEEEEGPGLGALALDLLPPGLSLRLGLAEPEMPDLPEPVAPGDAARVRTVQALYEMVEVRQVGSYAPVILITVTSENPQKATLLANAIAEQYIVDQLEAKFEATRRATTWLSERVGDLKETLEKSEAGIAAFKREMSGGQGQGMELTEKQMSELSTQLIDARAARANAEAEVAQLRAMQAAGEAAGASAGETVDTAKLAALRGRRAELLSRERQYPAGDPQIAILRAKVSELDRQIADETRKAAEDVRIRRELERATEDLAAAHAREQAISDSLKELEQRSFRQSKEAVRLRQMEREAEANRLIYETFLNRLKETSEQSGLQQADARLISPAEAAEFAGTSTVAMLARFLALGIVFGLGIVYLAERFNNTFRTAAEVEDGTGAPVLSSLPRTGRRSRREQVLDYIRDKPISALAEGVRNLRTALLLSSIDEPPKVVMVTSSLPGEGKSTTSLLLAYMSTQMGRKAIVVDCDIRRPTLARSFKLEGGGDLISVLDRSSELDATIQFDKLSGLHLLPTRNSVPQAADVLSSNRFAQLIGELSERFDLVVLDAPPVLLVSDAGAIGKCADATIYAIQWDQTPREAAKKGLKQLRDFGIRVNGTVLTLVNRRAEAQYSSYQYGYGMYRNKYYVD